MAEQKKNNEKKIDTTKKQAATKPAVKKQATTKPTVKKTTTAKKPVAPKSQTKATPAAKKQATTKPTVKKTTTAKKPVAPKSQTKATPAAKKQAATKPAVKKNTTAKKPVATKSQTTSQHKEKKDLPQKTAEQLQELEQIQKMQGYYKLHAWIYDLTRWTFLFGREEILKKLPIEKDKTLEILEIGCGTGKNLKHLAKQFPKAHFTAFEVSADMLKVAEKKLSNFSSRVTLIEAPYGKNIKQSKKFDVILFSYSLTMINPQYAELIKRAKVDLKKDGLIAVVDFHDTSSKFYRNYMLFNHVKMEAHLLPVLEKNFSTHYKKIGKGYLWQYLLYIGVKK